MMTKEILKYFSKLTKDAKEALQISAFMGACFNLDHILDLSSIRPSMFLEILDEMIDKDFIHKDKTAGKGSYAFSSVRLSDAILGSMKKDIKGLYLNKIIEYLEKELPKDDKKPLLLAELYLKLYSHNNRLYDKKRAADLIASTGKSDSAISLYKEIIDGLLSASGHAPLDDLMLVDSVISYSHVAVNIFPPDELIPLIESTLPIAKKLKNQKAVATLEVSIGRLYQSKGLHTRAVKHYKIGWSIAENISDQSLIKSMSKVSALSLFWEGKINDAIQAYEETIENIEDISPKIQDLWTYLMLSYCYGISGRIARGLGLAEVLKDQALSKKDLKAEAFSEAIIALILLEIRHIDEAIPHIDRALSIGKRLNSYTAIWMAMPCQAFVLYSKGKLSRAKKVLKLGLSYAEKIGVTHYPSPWILEILLSLHNAREEPLPGYSFSSEIERLKKWPDIYMKGTALRYEAMEKLISDPDLRKIESLLRDSQELLKKAGANIELARTQVQLAKLYISSKSLNKGKLFANKAFLTFFEIDKNLFPTELLFLIKDQELENRMLKGVTELSDAVDSFQNIDGYLGKVVNVLTNMFGAERAAVFLKGDKNTDYHIQIAAARNFSPEELNHFEHSPLQTIVLSTLDKKQPIVVNKPDEFTNDIKSDATDFFLSSLACIPLVIHGETIGLIYVDNRLLEGIFSRKDLVIMSSIAAQVALKLKTFSSHRNLYPARFNLGEEDIQYTSNENTFNKAFPQIVGNSKAIKSVIHKIKKVSNSDATVLIYGETGVGKELVAHAIHHSSRRASNPFIAVNISALSANLLPSELFGYEKGAFTGADKTRIGRFEMAHNGTIFLDEIGDLPLDSQVKILRVLQEGEFERVGGTRTIKSDFQLIAATNRNLDNMVAKGSFRSDLFYRINTFPIEIPPLRQRQMDIPILAHYFLKKYNIKHQKKITTIPQHELKKLMQYSWPGNIRELEHVIERSLILSDKEEISIPDLEKISDDTGKNQKLKELLPLDEISRRHIILVLDHTKWRIRGPKGAANILGLKPSTLEYRMKKLRIFRHR
ncbi:hypothetical protein DSCW_52330 [Desulfosarcina widdelii]|uniref:Sigma-54 factor interaction domain-containing protein n=1 Tax=Desulfosarcina widdelii TaxID=947919 RepID=A0A5K7Z7M6_9BACT|nr:sigma 54-interacting transcriptional regulator [Desulfosarcina widdelii]BBO77816.1 hypothetical protein DSCW_52330 [Desulfosarcina widdelii]